MGKGGGMADLYGLLNQLGVTANYAGFFHMACAKRMYPDVAKQYGTNWKAVERNIRTVCCVIWRENRPLLEGLAHRPLAQKPRNAQMLAILASQWGPDLRQLPPS